MTMKKPSQDTSSAQITFRLSEDLKTDLVAHQAWLAEVTGLEPKLSDVARKLLKEALASAKKKHR